MKESIVTLTTDWGDRDHYVAMVKGRLYSLIPGIRVVDLSHSQRWDSIASASKIVQYGCLSFPVGTVHIVDFGEDVFTNGYGKRSYRPVPMLAECKGHYILCSNRRFLEMTLDSGCDSLVTLPLPDDKTSDSDTFWAHSLFCDVAALLCEGAKPSEIGVPAPPLTYRGFMRAQYDGSVISARPEIIDHYGNVTLNLKYSDFKKYCAGRKFRLELQFPVGTVEKIPQISDVSSHYGQELQGRMVLAISSTGHLQLAITCSSFAELMDVNYSTVCRFVLVD